MTWDKYLTLFATTALALILGACGWHLRGSEPLADNLKELYLKTDGGSASLDRTLARSFKSLGVNLVKDRNKANYQLSISDLRQQRRTISTSGRGKAAEYELTSLLNFEVMDSSGDTLLGPEVLTTERIYLFDPDNALGAQEEERILRSEMLTDLVQKIIRRYGAIKSSAGV